MPRLSLKIMAGRIVPALVIFLQAVLAWAQGAAPQGLYRGSVQEPKGGRPIPEAILLFTDKNSGVGYMAVSNEQGEYQIHVPRGSYTLVMMIGEKTYEPEEVVRQGEGTGWSMTFAPVGKAGLSEQQLDLASDRQDVVVQRTNAAAPRGARKLVRMEIVSPPPAETIAEEAGARPEGTAEAGDAGETTAGTELRTPVVREVVEQPPQAGSQHAVQEPAPVQAEPHVHADLDQPAQETPPIADPSRIEAPPVERPSAGIDPAAINAALGKAYFDFNRFDLRDEAGAILTQAVILLDEKRVLYQPDLWLFVEGHCDEIGSDEYNDRLGRNRAEAARNLLVAEGLPSEKIRTVSYGRRCPLGNVEGSAPENRRVELRVVGLAGADATPPMDGNRCPAN